MLSNAPPLSLLWTHQNYRFQSKQIIVVINYLEIGLMFLQLLNPLFCFFSFSYQKGEREIIILILKFANVLIWHILSMCIIDLYNIVCFNYLFIFALPTLDLNFSWAFTVMTPPQLCRFCPLWGRTTLWGVWALDNIYTVGAVSLQS